MTIFATSQLKVTLNSICNSCNVYIRYIEKKWECMNTYKLTLSIYYPIYIYQGKRPAVLHGGHILCFCFYVISFSFWTSFNFYLAFNALFTGAAKWLFVFVLLVEYRITIGESNLWLPPTIFLSLSLRQNISERQLTRTISNVQLCWIHTFGSFMIGV